MKTIKKILSILGIYVIIGFVAGFCAEVCAFGGMATEAEAISHAVTICLYAWPIVIIICCVVGIKGIIGFFKRT